jgi:dipeptidyl aminopeptidase/acylaminoacyl peptidase
MIIVLGLAAALAAASGQAAPVQPAPPPVEDYGRLPAMEHVTLSPAGDRYAYVALAGGERRVVVAGTDNKIIETFASGKVKVLALGWAGEDHLLITTSETVELGHDWSVSKTEIATVTAVNLATHKAIGVFQKTGQERVAPVVVGQYGTANIGGKWYGYFGGYSYDGTLKNQLKQDANGAIFPDLYRVDLDTGQLEQQTQSDLNSAGWLVGPDGQVQARELRDELTGQWSITATQHHGAVIASGKDSISAGYILGFGRTPNTVLIAEPGDDGAVYEEIPLAGGPAKVVTDLAARGEPLFDRTSGVWLGGDGDGAVLFSPALQAKLAGARKAFAGYRVQLIGHSADFDHLIMETEAGDDSGTYWIVDINSHAADPLGQAYPTVTPDVVGPVRMIDWKAADGMALQGVLTLPPGRAAKTLPVVVMPHGGPSAHDSLRFDYWAQAFAARGYAVFQPNFRGSDGGGLALQAAGYGQWGRKMQTDISDGVAELARQGLVDPKRACIVGASYGGYAAQAGVTLQHGLYRCAVSYGGLSDLAAFLRYETKNSAAEVGSSSATRWWRRFMGVTSAWSDAQVRDISPITLADRADAPLLLIHGREDTVAPIAQSEAMAAAMRSAGRPVELLALPGADHWLLEEDARIAMLKASVDFVMKYDPPDPAPTAIAAK